MDQLISAIGSFLGSCPVDFCDGYETLDFVDQPSLTNATWYGIGAINSVANNIAGGEIEPSSPIGSGLIGLWHLNNNFSNSVSGGVNGQCVTNCPIFTAGKFNNAAQFNGAVAVNNVYNYVDLGSLTMPPAGTLAAWIKSDFNDATEAGDHMMIFSTGGASAWQLQYQGGGGKRYIFYTNATARIIWKPTADLTGWHQLVVSWDNTGSKLYLDGQEINAAAGDHTQASGQAGATLGAMYHTVRPVQSWLGGLDEVAVWQRVLNAGEIQNLFAGGGSPQNSGFRSKPIIFSSNFNALTPDWTETTAGATALEVSFNAGANWCPTVKNQQLTAAACAGLQSSPTAFLYRVNFSGQTSLDAVQFTKATVNAPIIGAGRTLYVDQDNKFGKGCHNSWPGTVDQPKCNFEGVWAESDLEPGDTVIVREANYRNIRLFGSSSGAVNNPIVIKPYPGEKINLIGGVQQCVLLYDRNDGQGVPSYITIQGPIEISNCEYSYAVSNGSRGLKLSNCDIHNVDQGPRLFGVSDSEISNCEIHNIRVNGVQMRSATNITIDNVNVTRVNDNRSPDNSDADGFHTYGGENIVIKNSSSSYNAEDGFDLNANATLINVKAHHNNGAGLKVWRRTEDNWANKTVTVANSLFYNNGYYAPDPDQGNPGIKVSDGGGLNLYHSVVYGNYDEGIRVRAYADDGSYLARKPFLPVVIKNTVIAGTVNGPGLVDTWNCTQDIANLQENPHCASVAHLTSGSNNLFFNNSGGHTTAYSLTGTPSTLSFTNNITADPIFVAAAAGDFHLAAASAARDVGISLSSLGLSSLLADLDGLSRPQGAGWDIGAFEYQSGEPPQPTNHPPTVSTITHDIIDRDPVASGWQVYQGDKITLTGSVSDPDNDPLTWQWLYTINNSQEIGLTRGATFPPTQVQSASYAYPTGPAGQSYNFILRASDGQAVSQSSLLTTVISRPVSVNQAPMVNAGSDQMVNWPANSVVLSGKAEDDGLPKQPGAITVNWSKISGPGTMTFANPAALTTTATFSVAGLYTLRLTANDSLSTDSDELSVLINPQASITHTLTTQANHGRIDRSLDLTAYPAGTAVTLTVVPDAGWYFDHWSGALTDNINPATVTLTANQTVTANFNQIVVIGGGGSSSNNSGGSNNPPPPAASTTIPLIPVLPNVLSTFTCPNLTGPFTFGTRSQQVTYLQQMLAQYLTINNLTPVLTATGLYDSATINVVQTFQRRENLLAGGSPQTTGFGIAGALTRQKLNTWCRQTFPAAGPANNRQALLLQLLQQLLGLLRQLLQLVSAGAGIR